MIKRTLHELYANHAGKMSDKWSLYLDEYDRLFSSMRDRPVRLLEIGVQNGGSLDIWSQFFPKAQAIVGCDINPDCERLTYDDSRIGVIVGNANDPRSQQLILQRSGQFDIVIDQLIRELDNIRRSTSWRMMAIPRLLVTRMRSLASDAPWTGNLRRILSAGVKSLRRAFSRSNST